MLTSKEALTFKVDIAEFTAHVHNWEPAPEDFPPDYHYTSCHVSGTPGDMKRLVMLQRNKGMITVASSYGDMKLIIPYDLISDLPTGYLPQPDPLLTTTTDDQNEQWKWIGETKDVRVKANFLTKESKSVDAWAVLLLRQAVDSVTGKPLRRFNSSRVWALHSIAIFVPKKLVKRSK